MRAWMGKPERSVLPRACVLAAAALVVVLALPCEPGVHAALPTISTTTAAGAAASAAAAAAVSAATGAGGLPRMTAGLGASRRDALAMEHDKDTSYLNSRPVNTSESLRKIAQVPLKYYEFKYDSVPGRVRFGVIGEELETYFPDSVKLAAERSFPNPNATGPAFIKLRNFPVIDKDVLFMHNVAAMQELSHRYQELEETVGTLLADEEELHTVHDALTERLEEEIEAQAAERKRIAQAEKDRELLLAELETEQAKQDALTVEQAQQEELALRKRQEELSKELAEKMNQLEATRLDHLANVQNEFAMERLERQREADNELARERSKQETELEALRQAGLQSRTEAELSAKQRHATENEGIKLQRVRAKAEEDRKQMLALVNTVALHLSQGLTTLLQSPHQLGLIVLCVVGLVLSYFIVKEGTALVRKLVEARIGRPSLIRESTVSQGLFSFGSSSGSSETAVAEQELAAGVQAATDSATDTAASSTGARMVVKEAEEKEGPLSTTSSNAEESNKDDGRKPRKNKKQKQQQQSGKPRVNTAAEPAHTKSRPPPSVSDATARVLRFFADVILPSNLRIRVQQLAISTKNAMRNHAHYRHVLLYGPPGTGKTMVARRLAMASGMDFAVMSGGDVGPLGKDAVTELHKLFSWAKTSRRGLLLFVDEAEAFLGNRKTRSMSEHMRNALNALLYHTGQHSSKFMMVLATNRAEDLDDAVLDRVDESLFFDLPSLNERASLLQLYFELYVKSATRQAAPFLWPLWKALGIAGPRASVASTINARVLTDVAERVDGFSGREIAKLMISVQNALYGADDLHLSLDSFRAVVDEKIDDHERKQRMMS